VRAELARLGDDASAAPGVPRAVRERAAPRRGWAVRYSALVGVAAVLAAIGIGTIMLVRAGDTMSPFSASALRLTTDPPGPTVPLSDAEIIGLLTTPADLGTLGDARRRASCLNGLGYPGSGAVLGGQQVQINGSPAVLLVLPGDTRDTVNALAVRPNCSSIDTGLLADTLIRRP
jgi:hypothetical protein